MLLYFNTNEPNKQKSKGGEKNKCSFVSVLANLEVLQNSGTDSMRSWGFLSLTLLPLHPLKRKRK